MTKKKKSASGAATKKVSTTETGHAKNLANFETLIIDCQGFGTAYNPSNSAITITALQTIYTNATNALMFYVRDVVNKTNVSIPVNDMVSMGILGTVTKATASKGSPSTGSQR